MNNQQNPESLASSEQNQPQTKSKKTFVIVMSIVAVCLIGGGALAYQKFISPTVSPANILKKSLQASLNTKTVSFTATSTGQIENQLDNGLPASANFSITSNGSIDVHSLDNLLLSVNLKTNALANSPTTTGSLLLDLKTIYANKNFYLNLNKFDISYSSPDPKTIGTQMFVGMAKGIVSSLENKWLQIDISKTLGSSSTDSYFTKEDAATFENYKVGMSYITTISNVGKETTSNIPTYHLKLTIKNGKELNDLIRKFALEKQPVAPKDMAKFDKEMDDLAKIIDQKIDLDVWVGRNDSLIYKIITSPIIISDEKSGTKSTVAEEITFSDHNQPVSITAPADAVSLQEMMQNLLGGMFGKK